ncbi:PP2C family protein-serine/threonine phosphatase [Streptomyces hirsutus]
MDAAMAAVVRETGAFGGLLYVLPPGDTALWLVIVAWTPHELATPWRRIALSDPIPVADAVCERRLVWIGGQEEMARRYPRPALVLPYDFAMAAAPVTSGTALQGGLVLLWSGPTHRSRARTSVTPSRRAAATWATSCGRPRTAALMGQVRTAVHAHATVGASPDDVLAGTNRLLTDLDPGLFTSCLYVHLDLAAHHASLATAGHPPPLLRHADGRTELLPVPPVLLLGIEQDTRCPVLEMPLPPGCVRALYTDGLVGAPGTDLDDATAALAGLVEHADPTDLGAMADLLIRHAPAPGDDIALLLLSPGG